MDLGAAAEAMMRRKLLEQIYDRMSHEERRLFIEMTMQNRSHTEIMSALEQQRSEIADIKNSQQTFGKDFLSNVAGNAAWDACFTRRWKRASKRWGS